MTIISQLKLRYIFNKPKCLKVAKAGHKSGGSMGMIDSMVDRFDGQ